MEKQNIIFLDIDGVLNCQLFYTSRPEPKEEDYPHSEICKERMSWLNDLCKETNASVVLSSTWRHKPGIVDILQQCGATFSIIGMTPDLGRFPGSVRGNEILAWLEANKTRHYKYYAIIDDDSDMLYWQRNNLFLTDTYSGLTPNTCYRIKQFFEQLS